MKGMGTYGKGVYAAQSALCEGCMFPGRDGWKVAERRDAGPDITELNDIYTAARCREGTANVRWINV